MDITKLINLVTSKLESWLHLIIEMLPNLFLALLVIIITKVVAKTVNQVVKNLLDRFLDNKTVSGLISALLLTAIHILGLFSALSILQLDKAVTSLLAGAGVLGLALGFAFQEIASNFISGIFIAFKKPYKVGDIIEIEGFTGEVTDIQLRITKVTTFQGLEVLVPNKDLFTKALINYTSTPFRRIDLEVGVSYSDDLEKVEEIALKALEKLPHRISSRPISVYFHSFGDSSINFSAQVWINYVSHAKFLEARHRVIIEIKKAFDQNQITIPFPIRTLEFQAGNWPLQTK